MQEKEMIHDLVLESKEHLLSIEPDLLQLERSANAVSDELINRIFRAIHSIKGGFGFFGFEKVTRLSHTMENILSRIRDHDLGINSPVIDALLQGIDKLRVLIDDISNSDSVSIDQELEKLSPFRSDTELKSDINKDVQAQASSKDMLAQHHPGISEIQLEEASKNGQHVYVIMLKAGIDLQNGQLDPSEILKKWEKFGTILDFKNISDKMSDTAIEKETETTYSVVFASVLEPDLIGYGSEISNSQIFQVNLSKFKKDSLSVPIQKNDTSASNPIATESKITSQSKSIDDTLRVRVNLLNNLMNLAGELVLGRNQIIQLFNRKLVDLFDNINSSDVLTHNFDMLQKKITDTSRSDVSLLPDVIASEVERVKRLCNSTLSLSLKELPGISTSLQSLDSVTSLLQENIMQTRLQPVSVVFNKFPRVVRDLAHKLGKQMELTMSGQDVELDKSIIEILSDPLTHLIRNCCDHGIESVRERIASGKSPTGNIILNAYQEGGKVIIAIEDDGKGIDIERIKKSALKRNLINEQEANTLSEHELQMLIMKPGFSTVETISDISGRGVGMDVVRSNIEKLGGTVTIESEFGKGTRFYLTLPLTLAIIPSLIVSVEGRNFAVPQVGVEELIRIRSFEITKKIERIQGAEVTRLRGKLLPLVRLADILKLEPTFIHPVTGERLPDKRARWSDRRGKPHDENSDSEKDERRNGRQDRRDNLQNAVKIVILKTGQHLFGLVVDKVFDSEEIVVKPLPDVLKSTQCYAGATIMGDGKVAMILDPGGIAAKAELKFSDIEKDKNITQEKTAKHIETSQNFLLFDNNTIEQFGIDLSTITRIEYINKNEIEQIGNREFIKRDGHSVSLVRIHDYLPVSAPEATPDEFYLLLPRQSANRLGIIAGRVYDILNSELNLDKKDVKGTGILGSTIINNKLVIILNVNDLVTEAGRRFEVTYE
jgi:two-component system chemotaxis sensor kinase CheA